MNRFWFILLPITMLVIASCSASQQNRIPTIDECIAPEVQSADDIVYTPGGPAYRANLRQEGVVNPWPKIVWVTTFLHAGDKEFMVGLVYRHYIETKAGEARNNILRFSTSEEGVTIDTIELYTNGVPEKISIAECMQYVGPQSSHARVLSIIIGENIPSGDYTFGIGFIINGLDYGMAACTIEVIEPASN
jgi:hypothetical protein